MSLSGSTVCQSTSVKPPNCSPGADGLTIFCNDSLTVCFRKSVVIQLIDSCNFPFCCDPAMLNNYFVLLVQPV